MLCFKGRESFEVSWVSVQWKLILEGRTRVVSAPRPLRNSLAFMRIGRYYDVEPSLAVGPERPV